MYTRSYHGGEGRRSQPSQPLPTTSPTCEHLRSAHAAVYDTRTRRWDSDRVTQARYNSDRGHRQERKGVPLVPGSGGSPRRSHRHAFIVESHPNNYRQILIVPTKDPLLFFARNKKHAGAPQNRRFRGHPLLPVGFVDNEELPLDGLQDVGALQEHLKKKKKKHNVRRNTSQIGYIY